MLISIGICVDAHSRLILIISSSLYLSFIPPDFILTHKIFMPTKSLCNELLKQYQCQTKSQLSSPANANANANSNANSNSKRNQNAIQSTENGALSEPGGTLDDEYLVAKKRRVVKFIRCWLLITREHFFQQQQIQSFLTVSHQSPAMPDSSYAGKVG